MTGKEKTTYSPFCYRISVIQQWRWWPKCWPAFIWVPIVSYYNQSGNYNAGFVQRTVCSMYIIRHASELVLFCSNFIFVNEQTR